jgi:hypothetical protein
MTDLEKKIKAKFKKNDKTFIQANYTHYVYKSNISDVRNKSQKLTVHFSLV